MFIVEDFIIFVYVARYHMFTHFWYHTLTVTCSLFLFSVNLNDDAALLVGWCYTIDRKNVTVKILRPTTKI